MYAIAPEVAFILGKERDPELQPIDRKPEVQFVLVLAPYRNRGRLRAEWMRWW